MAVLAPPYRPRRPAETVLYGVVRQHLESFLAHARETYEAPVPRYVERELRAYLRCGVFAYGFTRCHCDACGHDLLVAFSCKNRAVCPSCAGRRMANTAAHWVDRVLSAVPVRQYVLSLPFELRALAAFKAPVLSALVRIFVEAIFARYRKWAQSQNLGPAPSGAVTFVQRFGSSINLNVHFHVVALDGVYVRNAAGGVVFHPAPPPAHHELDAILRSVSSRAIRWLGRHGHLDAQAIEDRSQASPQSALLACAAIAMRRGTVNALRDESRDDEAAASPPEAPRMDGAVDREGFNLHASVAIAADDDIGRERLCRYGARPPLALDRLRRLPGGQIAYRIKKFRDGRAKHRVMTPLEFLARLAALVAPPRYPLLRYHGVLGPRSPWRRDVVPRPRESSSSKSCVTTAKPAKTGPASSPPTDWSESTKRKAKTRAAGPAPRDVRSRESPEPNCHGPGQPSSTPIGVTPQTKLPVGVEMLTPNVVSVAHWSRLLNGALYASHPRVDWATLLRRSFDVDVLECPACHGRLRVLGSVTEAEIVLEALSSLGLPTTAPQVARARDPTELFGESPTD